MHAFIQPLVFLVGMMVMGLLGYRNGRKDERLVWQAKWVRYLETGRWS